MKALRKIGLTLLIILLVYFIVAIFTNPTGVAAAISDPWNAIQLLTFRIAGLEERVAKIEKILGIDEQQSSLYAEEDKKNSPLLGKITPELRQKLERDVSYLYTLKGKAGPEEEYYFVAKVPTVLEGKVKIKYNIWIEVLTPWEKGGRMPATLQMQGILKNLSDEYISVACTQVWSLRDDKGNVLRQWEVKPLPGDKPIILRPQSNGNIGLSAQIDDLPQKLDINSISVELELKDVEWETSATEKAIYEKIK